VYAENWRQSLSRPLPALWANAKMPTISLKRLDFEINVQDGCRDNQHGAFG
jgi:hypothetical protein